MLPPRARVVWESPARAVSDWSSRAKVKSSASSSPVSMAAFRSRNRSSGVLANRSGWARSRV